MKNTQTLAVIVGRFQARSLHKGHRHLIDSVRALHADVLIVLGQSPFPTPRNPLSVEQRETMIHKAYPDVRTTSVGDHRNNREWSRNLDEAIAVIAGDRQVLLYGSRDSFITSYHGRYEYRTVPEIPNVSATKLRGTTPQRIRDTASYRAGYIDAFTNRLAVVRPMVDIAVIRHTDMHVLVGQKAEDGDKYRFVGGLVDATDPTLESAAKRELSEEVGMIEVADLTYVCSKHAEDWRYKSSGESGVTTLFCATYVFGAPKAADDIANVAWIPLENVTDMLVDEHIELGRQLINHLKRGA